MNLRKKHTFNFVTAVSSQEESIINGLLALARKTERTEEEEKSIANLAEYIPEVKQIEITVAHCNGLMKAEFDAYRIEAIEYFAELTGIQIPYDGELTRKQKNIWALLINGASALASTDSCRWRNTKPVITADGIGYEDTQWTNGIPDEIATLSGWFNECPESLQSWWSNSAYDVNPNLWTRGNDEASKNFGAVSVKE